MPDAKRQNIKRKVTAAKSRNKARAEPASFADRAGEKAIEAKDKFTAFAKKHPIATVAGGLAVGVLVSGLFRGSPTRKAGKKLGKRAAGLAALAAELAIAYGQSAMEKAGDAREAGAEKLGSWTEDAADCVTSARAVARDTGKSITQALRDRLN
uniref:hypothetical protein n=1 Tax=Altererythrobacter segetis TaxID=1104773 RepID=UPI00140B7C19|nr:hypothetical protein [Altererythrobacter segetis]